MRLWMLNRKKRVLERKTASANEEILALVGNQVVGMAGIDAVGACHKVSHRAEFALPCKGILGTGAWKGSTKACMACAEEAGYAQLELSEVASCPDNQSAILI